MEIWIVFLSVTFQLTNAAMNRFTIAPEESAKFHNQKRHLYQDTPSLTGSKALGIDAAECARYMISFGLPPEINPCFAKEKKQGENIYTLLSCAYQEKPQVLFSRAIDQWYGEINQVHFDQKDWPTEVINKKELVEKAIQFLWSSTTEVGCGGAYKEVQHEGKTCRKIHFVCRYTPRAEISDEQSLKKNIHPLIETSISKKEITNMHSDAPMCFHIPIFYEGVAQWQNKACNIPVIKLQCPSLCTIANVK
ncbi:uncharacterized protein LOC130629189 [Hydractinia symbiolongicarpus]|uniref:uncharacterized protein LOC130629189 n=1 Tax=Hydractinia symbiolongicarpus TaxID=13093 RepID=UPI00254A2621|nr:uncharacterized protein LOC130629189 [Hydractinia symbiolongicarpus]